MPRCSGCSRSSRVSDSGTPTPRPMSSCLRSTSATPRRQSRWSACRWKSRSPSSPSGAGESGPEQASPRRVAAGRAGPDARDARSGRGLEPGSLPAGLRRERSCLGAGTFTGMTPRAETHQRDAYSSRFRKTASPELPGWNAPMTHHIVSRRAGSGSSACSRVEFPHTQSDRDDRRPAR